MARSRVVAALLLLAAGCGGGAPGKGDAGWRGLAPTSAAPPRTILFVVADTLRADHLSLLGYPRPTSPRLEELARQATVYTNARSTAPWTLPSHASLFTGLYPHEHGAHTYMAEGATSADRPPRS